MEKIILSPDVSKKIKNKITCADIARSIKFSYSLVHQMLNGKRPINLEMYSFILENFPGTLEDCYLIYKYKRLSKIENILENTRISWYWIGFLLADGHFSKNGISLLVSNKDSEHLQKFIKFTQYQGKIESKTKNTPYGEFSSVGVTMGCKKEVQKLMKILNLERTCKTYNPPTDLPKISKEKLISMFIGFIDGDGCISKRKRGDVSIEIEIHSSWKKYMKSLINLIYECCNENYSNKIINMHTTAKFSITNPIVMKFLKNKISEYSLPILNRKWNNINRDSEKQISAFEIRRKREILLPSLIKQGLSLDNIADVLDMHKSNVCRMKKRLGL